jgi:hypothetical protein
VVHSLCFKLIILKLGVKVFFILMKFCYYIFYLIDHIVYLSLRAILWILLSLIILFFKNEFYFNYMTTKTDARKIEYRFNIGIFMLKDKIKKNITKKNHY